MTLNLTAKGIAISVLGLLLTACDKHKDRPFVMACHGDVIADIPKGESVQHYTDQFRFHAGHIPLPTPSEMATRVGVNRLRIDGYFGLMALTEKQGRLPPGHITYAPILRSGTDVAGWGDSPFLFYRTLDPSVMGMYRDETTAPEGNVRVEHYYLDGEDALHPIHFQIAAMYNAHTKPGG